MTMIEQNYDFKGKLVAMVGQTEALLSRRGRGAEIDDSDGAEDALIDALDDERLRGGEMDIDGPLSPNSLLA